jgi:hypothetical protein
VREKKRNNRKDEEATKTWFDSGAKVEFAITPSIVY